jgi:hypothetical protein
MVHRASTTSRNEETYQLIREKKCNKTNEIVNMDIKEKAEISSYLVGTKVLPWPS